MPKSDVPVFEWQIKAISGYRTMLKMLKINMPGCLQIEHINWFLMRAEITERKRDELVYEPFSWDESLHRMEGYQTGLDWVSPIGCDSHLCRRPCSKAS